MAAFAGDAAGRATARRREVVPNLLPYVRIAAVGNVHVASAFAALAVAQAMVVIAVAGLVTGAAV